MPPGEIRTIANINTIEDTMVSQYSSNTLSYTHALTHTRTHTHTHSHTHTHASHARTVEMFWHLIKKLIVATTSTTVVA